jgi:hypothetical protein
MFILAYPVSSLTRLSPEEYKTMAEYTFSTGLDYKGKDFLEWRYGWLDVIYDMMFIGFGFIGAAICLRAYSIDCSNSRL